MRAAAAHDTGRERTVEVAVDGVPAPRWRGSLREFCARVLLKTGVERWDLSLLLCNDVRMADLNGRYRGKARPTDVLSFPREAGAHRRGGSPPMTTVAGDIAISLETMRRNVIAYQTTEDEELKRLVVHGILHCAGMDHGAGKGRTMLSLQRRLLESLKEERIIEK